MKQRGRKRFAHMSTLRRRSKSKKRRRRGWNNKKRNAWAKAGKTYATFFFFPTLLSFRCLQFKKKWAKKKKKDRESSFCSHSEEKKKGRACGVLEKNDNGRWNTHNRRRNNNAGLNTVVFFPLVDSFVFELPNRKWKGLWKKKKRKPLSGWLISDAEHHTRLWSLQHANSRWFFSLHSSAFSFHPFGPKCGKKSKLARKKRASVRFWSFAFFFSFPSSQGIYKKKKNRRACSPHQPCTWAQEVSWYTRQIVVMAAATSHAKQNKNRGDHTWQKKKKVSQRLAAHDEQRLRHWVFNKKKKRRKKQ